MPSRPNLVLAIVVGAVAVLAIAVVVLSATRPTPQYDRTTPVGTVQAYLSAVLAGDNDSAAELLGSQSPCTIKDLDLAYAPSDGVSAVLHGSDADARTARVSVDIVTSSGPFGGSEYSERQTFRLTRTAGDWRITGEPWPMFACGGEG